MIRRPPQDAEWKPRGPRDKCRRKSSMRIFFNVERPRPPFLDSVAESMKQTESGIARPGEYELASTTGPDHLIEDEIGAQPNQCEVLPLLPDNFMSGRKRDQMAESFQRHGVAIMNELRDRVLKSCRLHHERQRSKSISTEIECLDSVRGVAQSG